MQFPLFKTKIKGITQKFNLSDPRERKTYFELKAGKEIKKLRDYLKKKTFIAYLLGKKNSGKGTYAKMFKEVVDKDRIEHFSLGDTVRNLDGVVRDKKRKKELILFLEKNYRGYSSVEEIISVLEKRSTKSLLPSELVLTLAKMEIAKRGKKTFFIDGFPRSLDQVSYSLFFRDLIDYREDPDLFILIDVPKAVIDERIRWRRVCPKCQTSRNLKLLPTSKAVRYDEKNKQFYLICDNPNCKEERMISKEGDELGNEPIRKRLEMDEKLMRKTFSLYGIPKVLLRNCIPVEKAAEYVDDYEITSGYDYKWLPESSKVKVIKKPWQVFDDDGVTSYSLLAAPVVLSLIRQMVKVLNLDKGF
jgi:adenylate kinase family enzyme